MEYNIPALMQFAYCVDVYIAKLEQRVEELEDKNQLLTDLNESLSEQIAKLGDTVKIKIPQLEAETEQLKNSQSQKQKIKLHEKIEQLEVEKAELLKYIEFAGKCCNSHGAYEYGKTFQSILKKHGVSL